MGPILSKAVMRQGSRLVMKIGDNTVDYNENFRFYLTTKLANPHYSPEVWNVVEAQRRFLLAKNSLCPLLFQGERAQSCQDSLGFLSYFRLGVHNQSPVCSCPQICTKALVINFAVREDGLEDQLLKIVVRARHTAPCSWSSVGCVVLVYWEWKNLNENNQFRANFRPEFFSGIHGEFNSILRRFVQICADLQC